MVFSSHLFAFYFLPLALALYYVAALGSRRLRHLLLTLLSYLFYGWANPLFVVLMLTSTVVDYFCGLFIAHGGRLRIAEPEAPLAPPAPDPSDPAASIEAVASVGPDDGARSRRQRLAVAVSVCANLGLLGFFKYFNFGVDSYNELLTFLGSEGRVWETAIRVTLPLGISFYTFQSMSYTIDVYRGQARALSDFIDFACYVSMFPQLVAGPIVRFGEVADQLRQRAHTLEKFARGAALFCLGMAKKVLLANPCGAVADATFEAHTLVPLDAWFGVTAYAFQIYFDFSGYSDMAIGLGLMLGFVFPKNFDSPYLAVSITDFWRRWHISLSSWLRDYLYIPLGGNRKGRARTYVNLMLVMLLGGLWHGAAWTFVLWGGYHGLLLVVERAVGKRSFVAAAPRPVKIAATFVLVLLGWVLFRARDLGHALSYFGSMFGLSSWTEEAELLAGVVYQPYYLLLAAIAAVVAWAAPQAWDWTRRLPAPRAAACLGVFVLALLAMETQGYNPFIYFIF